jgi:hypothetical protein
MTNELNFKKKVVNFQSITFKHHQTILGFL